MVVSRMPTPEPLVERPIEELSLDEVQELARRQKVSRLDLDGCC
jgi:hypothetical protein